MENALSRNVEEFREDPFSSFHVKLLTDKQTDRQTNAGHYITSLADVITCVVNFIAEYRSLEVQKT